MDIKEYTKDLLGKIDELSGEELEKLFTEALNKVKRLDFVNGRTAYGN
jgi:hypothetical protein